jgi:hypothetical protein
MTPIKERFSKFTLPKYCVGFTRHEGILVLWDEDYDPRVLNLILEMNPAERRNLVAIHEHKAMLDLYWIRSIPARYDEHSIDSQGDCFYIRNHLGQSDLIFDSTGSGYSPVFVQESKQQ